MPRKLAMNRWRTRFAILPTRMDNGRLVWLQQFEEMKTQLRDTEYDDMPYIVTRRRLQPERMIP